MQNIDYNSPTMQKILELLEDDPEGIFVADDPEGILDTSNLPAPKPRKAPRRPEYVSRARKDIYANENAPFFKEVHAGLANGTLTMIPAKRSDAVVGATLCLNGQLVHVLGVDESGRCDLVRDNGTRSDMLLSSLKNRIGDSRIPRLVVNA